LTSILEGNFKNIGSNFKKTIDRMVADAAAAQLSRFLLGDSKTGGGGFLSTAISAASSFFGGARAGGGDVMAGRGYLVGELGPEIFTPNMSGAIVPNNKLGGGQVLNVSNYFTVQGQMDRRSQEQIAAQAAMGLNRALARGT
jgi:phage-related minor tail protein